ncbi:hypothetical protein JHN59_00025 [Streptomyces sp. MBT49]|uniref:hypothetical protein n=1 Tax=Streptomyces sp. MBT49 TaxID=1488380 RepID=UPI00190AFC3E|nr:hypothetical protein [Streptomyces sp. MBT49]MBK3623263.1 hypothetical protein [Streptomyces sp. MBT49]
MATKVVTKTVDGTRRVDGLRWELLPLTAAQARCRPDPLVLEKRELSVLLALCEALFAPGWAPVGKRETPAGLLGARRGRGAAAERLALLRLVLAARPDGRVRLVGGAVAADYDRADATVARLLGCSVAEAARLVDGLVQQEALEVRGRGVPGARIRMVVPAVAAAHGRGTAAELRIVPDPAEDQRADEVAPEEERFCAHCASGLDEARPEEPGEGWVQQRFFDVVDGGLDDGGDGALRDQEGAKELWTGPESTFDLGEREDQEGAKASEAEAIGALLHADHAVVVTHGGSGAASSCFSGEAALGFPPLPERADGHEIESEAPQIGAAYEPGGRGSPLRGEQQPERAREGRTRPEPVVAKSVPLRWSMPRGLEQVLDPVRLEWARIGHAGGRSRVRVALKAELRRLAGIVGSEQAPVVLAERLERRLAAQHGERVREPVGWLLSRGLPQRAECYATACDDQVRMDTGLVCPSCELLIGDRRALRHQVVQAMAAELPRLAPARAEVERRLSREVALRASRDAVRRERAVVERARREVVWAQQREELKVAKAELAARACEECGVPEAAGLCPVCSYNRTARAALEQAAQVAAAVMGPVMDLGVVAGRLAAHRVRLEGEVDRVTGRLRREGMPEAAVAWEARNLAEELLRQERARAVDALLESAEAQAEAERVFGIERARRSGELQARAVSEQARHRCAELLLAQRLSQVRAVDRPSASEEVVGWRQRMVELAARPLDDEIRVPRPAAGECREAVSAA